MSAFSEEWLNLRAPFDRAARSATLARRFADAVRTRTPASMRIIDLASGNGASFMALAPTIAVDQSWRLVDSDPRLLAAQAGTIVQWAESKGWTVRRIGDGLQVEADSACWQVRSLNLDLSRDLETLALADFHGITTSAFLDLVSASWIDRLCTLLARHRVPLLAALTVDGRRDWHPALPADKSIEAAFCRHQMGDKGFGPALGERAVPYLVRRIADHGYATQTAPSDWQIAPTHRTMLLRMVTESVRVAKEVEPERAAEFDTWVVRREAQIDVSALMLAVGHVDALALPG